MCVHIVEDGNRSFAQYRNIGKEYYFKLGDKEGEERAIKKAEAQEPNIERFIRNYWATKND